MFHKKTGQTKERKATKEIFKTRENMLTQLQKYKKDQSTKHYIENNRHKNNLQNWDNLRFPVRMSKSCYTAVVIVMIIGKSVISPIFEDVTIMLK